MVRDASAYCDRDQSADPWQAYERAGLAKLEIRRLAARPDWVGRADIFDAGVMVSKHPAETALSG
jgi:hypothetical protein